MWRWLWYVAAHPSRGQKAHLFQPPQDRSACGNALLFRAQGDPKGPRRCQVCRRMAERGEVQVAA